MKCWIGHHPSGMTGKIEGSHFGYYSYSVHYQDGSLRGETGWAKSLKQAKAAVRCEALPLPWEQHSTARWSWTETDNKGGESHGQ